MWQVWFLRIISLTDKNKYFCMKNARKWMCFERNKLNKNQIYVFMKFIPYVYHTLLILVSSLLIRYTRFLFKSKKFTFLVSFCALSCVQTEKFSSEQLLRNEARRLTNSWQHNRHSFASDTFHRDIFQYICKIIIIYRTCTEYIKVNFES